MPNYSVIIQPEAELDLDEAFEYLEDQQAGLGFDLLVAFVDVIDVLEGNPLLFQKVYGEKRRAVIQRFHYNVIYIVLNQEVYILAVMHGSRDPRGWERR